MNRKTFSKHPLTQILFLLLATQLSGCASMYASADVTGRIIDKENGEPVAGAVVVGYWRAESQGLEHYYGPVIHVTESLTDEQGRYHLKGFDYQWVTGGWSLVNDDPRIKVLAEGYKPIGRNRYYYRDKSNMGIHRISPLNGKDVEIERMEITDYIKASVWESAAYHIFDDTTVCQHTKIPNTLLLFRKIAPLYERAHTWPDETLPFEDVWGVDAKTMESSQCK